jgi:O-antigen/teichoic acid export membrane protein
MTDNNADPTSLRASARGVLGGAALLASAQIVSRLFTMLFTLAIARLMSVADFGLMNLALSMVVVFALVQDLGISRTVVKEIARRPEEAALWIGRLVPAKLALACIAAVAMPTLAALSGYGNSMVSLLMVAACMLPSGAVWLLLENATQAVGAVRLLAGVTVTNAALQTGIGLVAALTGGGNPLVLVIAMGTANLLSTVILWRLLARRVGPIRLVLDLAFSRRTIAASLPYLAVAVAVAALGRVELLLVARIAGEVPAGLFAAAVKIFEAALFILYATQIAMNPTLARLVTGDRSVLERWLNWEFGALAASIVPVGACAYLLGGPLISLLYPAGYAAAGGVLTVLVAALPIVGLQVFTAGVLMLTDRQAAVLSLNLAVLAAQVGLSMALIPAYGALGAAAALACSQGFAAILGLTLIARRHAGPAAFTSLLRMLGASAIAVAAGLAVRAFAGDLPGIATAIALVALCMPYAKVRLLPPN